MLATCYGFARGGWSTEGATLAARYSARVSFYWFITAWSASSLATLWRGGWRAKLLARRRAVGLGFAAAHGVHFLALLTADILFGHESRPTTIIGGGIGYVFVVAMAATSNDGWIRRLGAKRWRLLHATGGWIVFGIFAVSYAGALAIKPLGAVPGVVLLALALAIRAAVAVRRITRQ
jgi:methionine sulfoxide reductase heme-binding subunit